ncbi:TPA: peptidylprolyl isomerase [Candidatus Galligastranaerophilus gallistercoris]|nr:peptidylprolyl isomerase [Candidatus Galligastranaerophilus gallistercoris]
MKLSKILLSGVFVLAALTGCTQDKNAIIKVNNEPITKSQYEEVYARETSSPQYQQFASYLKDENSIMSLMLKDRIVNELILKEIINQEIEKRKIEVTDEEIQARKDEITEKIGSKEKVEELLKRNNVSDKQFDKDIANEIKIDKLIEATQSTKISENDVKDFYNKNKAAFNYPERVRASHILIEANPAQIKQEIIAQDKKGELTADDIDKKVKEAMDNKMSFAQEVLKKAKANPDSFAALAKQYSDDKVSAQKGGDLGFFTRNDMVKPFADAAFTLKPGTVSEIVVTDYGNHIIIVTDKAAAGIQPFEKMKDEIQTYLEQKKKIDVLTTLLDGLKASAKVEYIDNSYDLKNIQEKIKEEAKKQQKILEDKEETKSAK